MLRLLWNMPGCSRWGMVCRVASGSVRLAFPLYGDRRPVTFAPLRGRRC